jgi:chemotaxis signal transduction protein
MNETLYGFDLNDVKEVVENTKIIPLPNASKIIKGAFNLRSEFVPLLDLKILLQTESTNNREVIVVVKANNYSLGIVVQNILGIYPVDGFQEILNLKHYKGVGISVDKEIYVLNPNDLISESGKELREK